MACEDLLMATHPNRMVGSCGHPLHDRDFALAIQELHQAFRSDACLLAEIVADAGEWQIRRRFGVKDIHGNPLLLCLLQQGA